MRRKLLIGLIVTVVLLAFVGRHFLRRLLSGPPTFFPGTRRPAPPEPHGPGIEVLKIETAGVTMESVFLPAREGAERRPLIIFAHGNTALVDDFLTALDGFRQRGVGVLLVEYPGYGRSTGAPSEASIRMALVSAYDRIVADPRVDHSHIVGFGQSFGGAAICLLAQDRPLCALILMSTFAAVDTFDWRNPTKRDHFDSAATVSHYSGPVLVIHGRRDPRIPWQQGQRLAAASPHAIFKLYDCEHDCWQPERLPLWQDLTPFLAQAGIVLATPA